MKEAPKAIRSAMHRLSHIVSAPHQFDEDAKTQGAGQIQYMVELGDRLCFAWENEDTGAMIVSPIVCWELSNMMDALGAPWPVLSLPDALSQRIVFREIGDADVIEAYQRMEGQAIAAPTHPVITTH